MNNASITMVIVSTVLALFTSGYAVGHAVSRGDYHHTGYLDGRVSMTRCAHGAAKVVDNKVACVTGVSDE